MRSLLAASSALAVATALTLSAAATAQDREGVGDAPQLQIGCKVAKIAQIDPIIDPAPGNAHNHVFFGNRSVNRDSTHNSLVRNRATTCNKAFDTSSYWIPMVRDGNGSIRAEKVTVYYVGTGEQKKITPIPRGLEMIGTRADYRCGLRGGVEKDPPYGCADDLLRLRVHFPNCWTGEGLERETLTYSRGAKSCPETHPKRLPSIRMAVHHANTNGLKAPLQVSMGGRMWGASSYMHGDIFHAGQQPAFDRAIQRCVIDRKDGQADKFCSP